MIVHVLIKNFVFIIKLLIIDWCTWEFAIGAV